MSESEANSIDWRGTNEGSKLADSASLWSDGTLENDAEFGTSGFQAFPGGHRYYNGSFLDLGYYAYFWSATEDNSSSAWLRYLYYDYSEVYRNIILKNYGFSVRCTKD